MNVALNDSENSGTHPQLLKFHASTPTNESLRQSPSPPVG